MAHAAADPVWDNGRITYEGNPYKGPNTADSVKSPKLTDGTTYYEYISPADFSLTSKAHVIYFAPGADPPSQKTAKYVTYTVSLDGSYSGRSDPKTLTIKPTSNSSGPGGSATSSGESSCQIEGIGWMVCPISRFMAEGMDNIFEMLKGFLIVKPLTTQNNNSLYQAWTYMRSFANVAFVISFLIIIYSQLTSIGINNYSIKKLLPRLIIAAILVNVSYWICAAAVDLSNILGDSVQQIFILLREALTGPNTNSMASWESVTSFILGGLTVTAAAGVGILVATVGSGASVAAAAILLLPMLLGLLLAVLVALIVLAARQAVIIILIIIAPLAFVAYLLPNTEKWFERWRSTFMTLLVFFPLFSLIFGGSQLAAFVIMQNANQLNIVLLAMFVQVAPLVLTPMLVKFSGNIVGKIAGMVNNPSKGLLDRTRNWAKAESEHLAKKNMARTDPVRKRQIFRRTALGFEQRRRNREEDNKLYDAAADNRYHGSSDYAERHTAAHRLDTAKETIDNSLKTHIQGEINLTGSQLHLENMKLEASKLSVEKETTKTAAMTEEYKTGSRAGMSGELATIANSMRDSSERVALNSLRSESAKHAFNENYTKDIESNLRTIDGVRFQEYAGGIQGIAGAQRALASAISAQTNVHSESVKNATTILNHGNYGDDIVGEIAEGKSAGTSIIVTDDMKEAAIMKIASGRNATAILKLMQNVEINETAENQDFRQAYADTLLVNPSKPKFAGAGIIANNKQGIAPPPGKARIDTYVVQTVNADKFGSAETLVTQDKEYLEALLNTIKNNESGSGFDDKALAKLKSEIIKAQTTDIYSGRIGERAGILDELKGLL